MRRAAGRLGGQVLDCQLILSAGEQRWAKRREKQHATPLERRTCYESLGAVRVDPCAL